MDEGESKVSLVGKFRGMFENYYTMIHLLYSIHTLPSPVLQRYAYHFDITNIKYVHGTQTLYIKHQNSSEERHLYG